METIMPPTPPASVERLDPLHRNAITVAALRLFDTALARKTFGQIIDGLPICRVAYAQRGLRLRGEHPILHHVTLCPGVEEAVAKFLSDFEMERRMNSTRKLASLAVSYVKADFL
jgi:hypothetical protein